MTELERPKDGQRIYARAIVPDTCGLPIGIQGYGVYHADYDTVENTFNGEHLPFRYVMDWEEEDEQ